ncbi:MULTISPECIES: hypothetical protein [Paenibacillus]|jgi:hypothetical protein|uniref:Bacterial Ig domain-containing protein n=1 Tax=Paenibacillus timonensis TaxID=225915 RepID=A0ABW3SBG0_9BACL|nr:MULTISPECIES: hypothetical protein [Paenibacillus]MCH1640179.1 hypothetical protein [Paenibacillus timonensis]MDU2210699.1 hypothetical protein [Eubacterium sp.]
MKKSFRLFTFASAVVLLFTIASPAYADGLEESTSSIHGHLNTIVQFADRTPEVVEKLYDQIGIDLNEAINSSIAQINNNTVEIITSLPETTLQIDGSNVNLSNGEFYLDGLTSGLHKISVYSVNNLIHEQEVILDNGLNHIPVDARINFGDLVASSESKMDPDFSKSSATNSSEITPLSDPDSWNGIGVGAILGEGKGKMLLLTNEGHVSCNKSDWDNGANFPANNSDCALAIAGGVMYSSNPLLFQAYAQGRYCLQESMNTVESPSTANVYCNQKQKASGYYTGYRNKGYNCSSFIFLGGDERLNKYDL